MPRPTLRYNSAEQAIGARHRQERGDAKGASRLAEDSYVTRIAAEGCDVLLHPRERCNLVEQTEIGNTIFQIEEAVRSEAIVDRDTYNSIASEATTIIPWYCA